jgi:hypothetical protein
MLVHKVKLILENWHPCPSLQYPGLDFMRLQTGRIPRNLCQGGEYDMSPFTINAFD